PFYPLRFCEFHPQSSSGRDSIPSHSLRGRDEHRVLMGAMSCHMNCASNRTSPNAIRPTPVSRTVQVFNVCSTVRLKLSFMNQNPPSFTCEQNNDPAP